MKDADNKIKLFLQEKLEEQFNKFSETTVNNFTVKVMPSFKDVPQIIKAEYNKQNDRLIIFLNNYNNSFKKKEYNHFTVYFLEHNNEKIIGGFEIHGLASRMFDTFKVQMDQRFGILKKTTFSNQEDIEIRKWHFFDDVIKSRDQLLSFR